MKILHYALGFPPYRSGGLTKFCVDLMVQQTREGHHVAMLWPGKIGLINKKTAIKRHKNVELNGKSIDSFEIVNPLPVPFDEGIADITAFTADAETGVYDELMASYKPDVVHIHTFMGLHKSFLMAAKKRKIRMVFTAHDFFPICPKVTMFQQGAICGDAKSCKGCGVCNTTSLSLKKIQILQSPIYRNLKDSVIVKKLRKQHRDNYFSEEAFDNTTQPVGTAEDYEKLRDYYYSLLKIIDVIHYNSSVTQSVYESFFDLPVSCNIAITHSDIKDNRVIKEFVDDKLRIRYLGPMNGAKGYFLLKEALDKLWGKRQDFSLDIHFAPNDMMPYVKVHGRYTYKDLKTIFKETDVLIAPSICYETFGFTVLEALSYGVPVIISGTVGAKDILVNGAGIIIEDISSERLCKVLQRLTPGELKEMNQKIVAEQFIMQIEDMEEQIEKICYGW